MMGPFIRRSVIQATIAMTPMAGGLGLGTDVIDLRGSLAKGGEYEWRDPSKIHTLVIHHTATTGQGWGTIAEFHVLSNQWAGIGYTFGTSWDGKKFLLGDIDRKHNQVALNNSGTVGLAMLGHFQHKRPTPEQIKATEELSRTVMEVYDIPRCLPHRAFKATACPGDSAVVALQNLWTHGW